MTPYCSNRVASNDTCSFAFLSGETDRFLEKRVDPQAWPSRLELSKIALQTKTADTIDHSYPRIESPQDGWFIYDWIELARIPSLEGKVTTLRGIDTFIGNNDGFPFEHPSNNTFTQNFGRYWLIYTEIGSGPRRVTNYQYGLLGADLPGNVLFRRPFWDDNRYSWGRSDNHTTFPLVPGYNLSLFFQFTGVTELPPEWQAALNYKEGDLIYDPGTLSIWQARFDHQSSGGNNPPDLEVWIKVYDVPNAAHFMSLAGRLRASVQDERDLSALWQARRTFVI